MKKIDLQLSEHFKLSEFCVTNHYFDDFVLTQDVFFNIQTLVNYVLEPLRTFIAAPVHISSGFRPAELNAIIDGAKNSYHLYGSAVDIYFNNSSDYQKAWDFLFNYFNEYNSDDYIHSPELSELFGSRSDRFIHLAISRHPFIKDKHISNRYYYE